MSKRTLHTVFTLSVFALAAVLLYFSLRGIQWKVVAGTIASIQPVYAALALAVGTLPMFVRAARWRILLEAQGPVSFQTTFWAVAAGYFGNNFLPARGGEFVRSYIVRMRSALGVSYVLATALSERAADAVALVLIGTFALLFIPQAPIWIRATRGSFALIGLAGVMGLACLPFLDRKAHRTLKRFPRLQDAVQQMLLGVRSFHNWHRLAQFTALTAIIWALDAIATSTLARSLSIPMPLSVAMLLIVALSLSSAVPSTPGYVGIYQFVAVTILKPFGISPSAAIAFILVTQALNYAVTSALGIAALTRHAQIGARLEQPHPKSA
jgi:uncharacterized protein (TIRG00374 family)